jgi:hypothetical protein
MRNKSIRKKICITVSSELTIKAFLMEHICSLSKFYNTSVIVNADHNNLQELASHGVKVISVDIRRDINLIHDLITLFKLIAIYREEKYDLIHSVTHKAGLLAMMAGKIANVPVRIHVFTGQVWANKTGIKKILLKNIDRLIAGFATHVLVDSE